MRETYSYDDLTFEWDPAKAAINEQKHGITFVQAASTWGDANAVSRGDLEHSWEEERVLRLGIASSSDLLLVVHCYRENSERIRLVSARKATKQEEELYVELRGMA